eukprot:scaffold1466_cov385-Prasinococcus_capsulatus_cf.AAC.7
MNVPCVQASTHQVHEQDDRQQVLSEVLVTVAYSMNLPRCGGFAATVSKALVGCCIGGVCQSPQSDVREHARICTHGERRTYSERGHAVNGLHVEGAPLQPPETARKKVGTPSQARSPWVATDAYTCSSYGNLVLSMSHRNAACRSNL